MKSPPEQFTDDEAHRRTEAFIAGEPVPAAALAPIELEEVNGHALRNGAKVNGVKAKAAVRKTRAGGRA